MKKTAIVFAFLSCLIWSWGCGIAAYSRDAGAAATGNTVYQSWKDSKRDRTIPVKIYLPTSGTGPFPVVIFSHGLGGSVEAAVYLGQYWSSHGYLCVFVQHEGSDTDVWKPAIGEGREAIMARMREAANGKNLVDRNQDIKFVLDELARRDREDPEFKGQMRLDKIGLAGHSFGAGTTLSIAGQDYGGRNMRDDRVKAAVYLCPPVTGQAKANRDASYGTIKIPGMLLTGTEDNSPIGETKAEDRRIPYDGIKAPHQFYLNFIGANHATFGGTTLRQARSGDDKFHEMIEEVTTKFLDASLKDDSSAWAWLDGSGIKTYLGRAAMLRKVTVFVAISGP